MDEKTELKRLEELREKSKKLFGKAELTFKQAMVTLKELKKLKSMLKSW